MSQSHRLFELRLTLRSSRRLAALLDRLEEGGIPQTQLSISEFRSKIDVATFSKSKAEITKCARRLRALKFPGLKIRIRKLEREDWLDRWKLSYRPFPVGKSLAVVPAWLPKTRRRRSVLWLDPGPSFGSGRHETSRLSLILMERLRGRFESFLDAGTGSGILSIAARHLGARRITALDSDPLSVEAARANFKRNGIRSAKLKEARLEDVILKPRWDLIAANLHSEALIRNQRSLALGIRPGKYLIVSGILKRCLHEFRSRFQPHGLRLRSILRGRSWAAILYQKGAITAFG